MNDKRSLSGLCFAALVLVAGTVHGGEGGYVSTPSNSDPLQGSKVQSLEQKIEDALAAADEGLEVQVVHHGERQVLPFGEGGAYIRTAPLRLSVIELEAGERVEFFDAGDDQRWELWEVPGSGDKTLMVVRPTGCNLATNLVIASDRRTYHLTLVAEGCGGADVVGENPIVDFDRHTSFYYPGKYRQASSARAAVRMTQRIKSLEEEVAACDREPIRVERANLRFGYTWKSRSGFPWVPTMVYRDGHQTVIGLPDSFEGEEAATLLAEVDGKEQVVSYRREGMNLVVDRELSTARMVLAGQGRRTPRLLIRWNPS